MANPTFPLRNEMDRQRMEYAVGVALSMLTSWYVTWEAYQFHRVGDMRRLALHSKCRGLVHHDRALAKCSEIIYG